MSTVLAGALGAVETPSRVERLDRLIKSAVADLNGVLGLPGTVARPWTLDSEPNVSYGYLGNVEFGHDDRRWYVFLPHPGRAGTYTDRLGGHDTGDVLGMGETLREVLAAVKGAQVAVEAARRQERNTWPGRPARGPLDK